MKTRTLLLAAVLAVSCGPAINPTWPTKTGEVTASLSSVSLAQDCAGGAGAAPRGVADCQGTCESLCRQSNLQLALGSTQQSGAKVEVRSVRVLDKATGALIDTLSAKNPQQWTGSAYAPWNQVLGAGATLKVTFDLSAPNWNTADSTLRFSSYGMSFRVEVDLAVDGVVQTLDVEAQREPEVVT